jgi:hypothetical protein
MAGRQDAKTDESGPPLGATVVTAWIFQGLFLGSIPWLVWGEPMYWVFADDMSLQWHLVLALPSLLSGYWLVEHYARRRADRVRRRLGDPALRPPAHRRRRAPAAAIDTPGNSGNRAAGLRDVSGVSDGHSAQHFRGR